MWFDTCYFFTIPAINTTHSRYTFISVHLFIYLFQFQNRRFFQHYLFTVSFVSFIFFPLQGTPARTARRALLEESKQRRTSDSKPRQGIFETLRQVSLGRELSFTDEAWQKQGGGVDPRQSGRGAPPEYAASSGENLYYIVVFRWKRQYRTEMKITG